MSEEFTDSDAQKYCPCNVCKVDRESIGCIQRIMFIAGRISHVYCRSCRGCILTEFANPNYLKVARNLRKMAKEQIVYL